jgi:hypothetical protein
MRSAVRSIGVPAAAKAARCQRRSEALGDLHQRREVFPDVRRVEARHHHRPLALPLLAVGGEHPPKPIARADLFRRSVRWKPSGRSRRVCAIASASPMTRNLRLPMLKR